MSKVYFIGAGPGDPGLLTIKGRRLLDEADVIVYAGSLVNPELLPKGRAKLYDSSGMSLEEIVGVLEESARAGRLTVRLHSGDTSYYSAISEQIDLLREKGIGCEVVPGVSSLGAGAAALAQELTIPGVSQSVIITRMKGRTPVPAGEEIASLAAHKSTMVIFLSIAMIEDLVRELIKGGYPEDTPAAVVEKASWPEERLLRGTLRDIAGKVREAGVTKTALVFVGAALGASGEARQEKSKLYDKDFSHGKRGKKT